MVEETGVVAAVMIGSIVFKESDRDPIPTFNWSGEHRVLEVPINGFADITIGLTGDGSSTHPGSGSLVHLKVTARSITEKRFRQFWALSMLKGPYMIQHPAVKITMYLKKWNAGAKPGELAPPYPTDAAEGDKDFVSDWSFDFAEVND